MLKSMPEVTGMHAEIEVRRRGEAATRELRENREVVMEELGYTIKHRGAVLSSTVAVVVVVV